MASVGRTLTHFYSEPPQGTQIVDVRIKAIDELQRLSREYRDRTLGPDWFKQMREMYDLSDVETSSPSFRPRIRVPQLQVLLLSEATDLSDNTPRVYIVDKRDGKRDEARERAFQEHWREGFVNEELLYSQLYALFGGLGYIQVGFDPRGRDGRGEVWAHHRDPATVFPDPAAKNDRDWSYVIIEDRLYPGQVAWLYPETGRDIEARGTAPAAPPTIPGINPADTGYGFELPAGPMSYGALGVRRAPTGDGRVVVRTTFLLDSTVDVIEREVGSDAAKRVSRLVVPKYPNGRMVVDCEGRVLADGPNPVPKGWFPLIRVLGLPTLGKFYPPPPARFTYDLQLLAQRMLTQTFENAVRLNNGIWFIHASTGITAEDFGGLPAEVRIINPNSQVPQCVWPNPMPEYMTQLPALLLQLQKELQGFTPTRAGEPGAGNISPDLFEASVFRSQTLTRLRGRLFARSVQQLAEMMFYMMVRFYVHDQEFYSLSEKFEQHSWKAVGEEAMGSYRIQVDPASIRPLSQAGLRNLVPQLRELGLIDAKRALQLLELPGAEEMAEEIKNERLLAALSAVRERRR